MTCKGRSGRSVYLFNHKYLPNNISGTGSKLRTISLLLGLLVSLASIPLAADTIAIPAHTIQVHQTGKKFNNSWMPSFGSFTGWYAQRQFSPNYGSQDNEGYLSYTMPSVWSDGDVSASFTIKANSASGWSPGIATVRLEIHDFTTNETIVSRELSDLDYPSGQFRTYNVSANLAGRKDHLISARVYWYGKITVLHYTTIINYVAPPTIELVSPQGNINIEVGRPANFLVDATDGEGLSSIYLFANQQIVDSDGWFPPANLTEYELTWTPHQTGEYSVYARVTDTENLTDDSDPITVSVINTPPEIVSLSPAPNSQVEANSLTTIEVETSDIQGVSRVEFTVNGEFKHTDGDKPFTFDWQPSVEGSHEIKIVVVDGYGEESSVIANYSAVAANDGPPIVGITSPSLNDVVDVNKLNLVAVEATDSDGIDYVELIVEGYPPYIDEEYPFAFEWTPTVERQYSLYAKAVDQKGAVAKSETITVEGKVPRTPPTTRITSPASGVTIQVNQEITIKAEASDNVSVDKVVIAAAKDGLNSAGSKEFLNPPYEMVWKAFSIGQYTIVSRAYDNEGTSIESERVIINVVDTSRPTVAITTPYNQDRIALGDTINVYAEAHDDKRVALVEFYVDGQKIGEDSTSPYRVSWTADRLGYRDFVAFASDDDGNRTPSLVTKPRVVDSSTSDTDITIQIAAPMQGAQLETGKPHNIVVDASDADGTITHVSIYTSENESTPIGTISSGNSITWVPKTPGNFFLFADATDNSGKQKRSPLVSIDVIDSGHSSEAPTGFIYGLDTSGQQTHYYDIELGESGELFVDATDDVSVDSIEFFVGSESLGIFSGPNASTTWTPSTTGNHQVYAVVKDNEGQSIQTNFVTFIVTQTIEIYPQVDITVPLNGEKFAIDENLIVKVNATDEDGSVQYVNLYVDGEFYKQLLDPPFEFPWSASTAGTYSFTAKAFDNDHLNSLSTAVDVIVGEAIGSLSGNDCAFGDSGFCTIEINWTASFSSAPVLRIKKGDALVNIVELPLNQTSGVVSITVDGTYKDLELLSHRGAAKSLAALRVRGISENVDLFADPSTTCEIARNKQSCNIWLGWNVLEEMCLFRGFGTTDADKLACTSEIPVEIERPATTGWSVSVGQDSETFVLRPQADLNEVAASVDLQGVKTPWGELIVQSNGILQEDGTAYCIADPTTCVVSVSAEAGDTETQVCLWQDGVLATCFDAIAAHDFVLENRLSIIELRHGYEYSGRLLSQVELFAKLPELNDVDIVTIQSCQLSLQENTCDMQIQIPDIGSLCIFQENTNLGCGNQNILTLQASRFGTRYYLREGNSIESPILGTFLLKAEVPDHSIEVTPSCHVAEFPFTCPVMLEWSSTTEDPVCLYANDELKGCKGPGEEVYAGLLTYYIGLPSESYPKTVFELRGQQDFVLVKAEAEATNELEIDLSAYFVSDRDGACVLNSDGDCELWFDWQTNITDITICLGHLNADGSWSAIAACEPSGSVRDLRQAGTHVFELRAMVGDDFVPLMEYPIEVTEHHFAVTLKESEDCEIYIGQTCSRTLEWEELADGRIVYVFSSANDLPIGYGLTGDWVSLGVGTHNLQLGFYNEDGETRTYVGDKITINVNQVSPVSPPSPSKYSTSQLTSQPYSGLSTTVSAVYDYNGDGKEDIAVQVGGSDSGTEFIAYGQGNVAGQDSSTSSTFHPITQETSTQKEVIPGGALGGKADVSVNGTFNYSIPIAVAPGASGTEPQIQLSYSSGGGNGLVGVGWDVSGVEMVTDCPTVYALDGYVSPTGRYCLNGQRLSQVGDYEYRTENESFTKILFTGFAFEVWYKSGEKALFRREFDDISGRRKYLLRTVSDRFGNTRSYSYDINLESGEVYIDRISYPGGYVVYDYEDRFDKIKGYDLGERNEINRRLDKVRTFSEGDHLVADYDLTYADEVDADGTSPYSKLVSVQQCSANGFCLAPTTFDWYEGKKVTSTRTIELDFSDPQEHVFAYPDFDGDGQREIAFRKAHLWHVVFPGNETKEIPVIDHQTGRISFTKETDFDGDGRTDFLIPKGNWHWYRWDENFVRESSDIDAGITTEGDRSFENAVIADLNGDGLQDLALQFDGKLQIRRNLGGQYTPHIPTTIDVSPLKRAMPIDMDGDGKQELLIPRTSPKSLSLVTYLSDTEVTEKTVFGDSHEYNYTLADVNGDGLQDYIYVDSNNGTEQFYVAFNNGKDFNAGVPTNIEAGARPIAGNFNDDPLQEVYFKRDTQKTFYFAYQPNDGSFTETPLNIDVKENLEAEKDDLWTVDLDGDGTNDFINKLCIRTSSIEAYDHSGRIINSFNDCGKVNLEIHQTTDDLAQDGPQDYIRAVNNGQGMQYVVKYQRPTTTHQSAFPVMSVNSGVTVVDELEYQEGQGQEYTTKSTQTYAFNHLKIHMSGLGSLGYEEIVKTSTNNAGVKSITTTTNSQDWEKRTHTMPTRVTLQVKKEGDANFVTLSESETEYRTVNRAGGKYPTDTGWYSYVWKTTATERELDNQIKGITTTEYSPDLAGYFDPNFTDFGKDPEGYPLTGVAGNMITVDTQVSDGNGGTSRIVTASDYTQENFTDWILGRVTRSQSVSTHPERSGNGTKTSAWNYYSDTGALHEEIVEPDNPELYLKTTYQYDPNHGGKSKVTVSDHAGNARTTDFEWDRLGRFVTGVEDALGQRVETTYHPVWGKKVRTIDPNFNQSTWHYDGFGRVKSSTTPAGVTSHVEYLASDQPEARYILHTWQEFSCNEGAGGQCTSGESWQYLNVRGDTIEQHSRNAIGTIVKVRHEYTEDGVLYRTSEPFTGESATHWTTNEEFDVLNRPLKIRSPYPNDSENLATVEFKANQKIITNGLGQKRRETWTFDGKLKEVMDEGANTIRYTYDLAGNTKRIDVNADGTTTTEFQYDLRARKLWMKDPSKGEWQYHYNAFGELLAQKDAEGNVICHEYDTLGRMIRRVDGFGESSWKTRASNNCSSAPTDSVITEWQYDTATFGLGKLHQVSDNQGYLEVYSYDSFGRVESVAKTIEKETFVSRTEYDNVWRPYKTTYPSGLTLENQYNQYGAVSSIRNAKTDVSLWRIGSQVDSRGNIKDEQLAGGLIERIHSVNAATGQSEEIESKTVGFQSQTLQADVIAWNALGNMQSRSSIYVDQQGQVRTRREEAAYDHLNRLKDLDFWSDYDPGSDAPYDKRESMAYEANGNIRSKWDIGSYSYNQSACAGAEPAGPHAVTHANGKQYCYNKNGDLTKTIYPSGEDRNIKWTSFGKPSEISRGDALSAAFVYGPNRARIMRIDTEGEKITKTKYVGSYEQVKLPTGVIEEKHYIGGFVVITKSTESPFYREAYSLKDHLGSITAYVDKDKLVALDPNAVEYLNYNAWGTRRDQAWVDYDAFSLLNYPAKTSRRGFTGHEHIDQLGLIHMNGRVYDPEIARFISADPIVQAPTDVQSYNRYAYVRNNPLTLTDPSGFSWIGDLLGKATIGQAKLDHLSSFILADKSLREFGRFARKNKYVAETANIVGCYIAGPYCPLVAASVTYGVTDGDMSATVKSGLIALFQQTASNQIGKSYGSGENTPNLNDANGAKSVIAHGVVGGVAAAMNGGSFRSGFFAGAGGKAMTLGLNQANVYGNFGIGFNNESWQALAARTTIAAVAGGTLSRLGGGNFANGAVTAAMQHIFNAEKGYWERMGDLWADNWNDLTDGVSNLFSTDGAIQVGMLSGSLTVCLPGGCTDLAYSLGVSLDMDDLMNTKLFAQFSDSIAIGGGFGVSATTGRSVGRTPAQLDSGVTLARNHTVIGFLVFSKTIAGPASSYSLDYSDGGISFGGFLGSGAGIGVGGLGAGERYSITLGSYSLREIFD